MTRAYDAEVTLVLEGTYPYVAGGVSAWVHQILCAYPARKFALLHIGPHAGAYGAPRYQPPANVTVLTEAFCRGRDHGRRRRAARPVHTPARRGPSRMLAAFRRLHVDDAVDDELIADLASNDLSLPELLHGERTFEMLRRDLYERLCPDAPFVDFFWHFRAMHVPLLRLLAAPCPRAAVYHAVATGYAGLVGAVASFREQRPLVVTEHGIYAHEREMELSRVGWFVDCASLRRVWTHYFKMLSRIAYHRAARLLTLSEVNRARQLADGADPNKIEVVPNGVDPEVWRAEARPVATTSRLRVGFIGRVVPIKDLVTLIRAIHQVRQRVPEIELWIVGPDDEDRPYAQRCRALVDMLGLGEHIRFLGPQRVAEVYPQLDVVVLTSLSEGQPLVVLEAHAAGLPVVATDVGACRELIEGGSEADRQLGASGIVTRVASPSETAAALVRLAAHPELRLAMGKAGAARIAARYQLRQVVACYDSLYAEAVG
ncbi:MAG TPA: GT4 family glycosyltransferase PelF [Kofleriaceae bacterium]|jgi:glycosyltransferase involved in cell wall biosynthesis|nr:GT4 family glycosyltransferase PelF [Kofleriaceae bacterium]